MEKGHNIINVTQLTHSISDSLCAAAERDESINLLFVIGLNEKENPLQLFVGR
jgi:hypothetical protein